VKEGAMKRLYQADRTREIINQEVPSLTVAASGRATQLKAVTSVISVTSTERRGIGRGKGKGTEKGGRRAG